MLQKPDDHRRSQNDCKRTLQKILRLVPQLPPNRARRGQTIGGQLHDKGRGVAVENKLFERRCADHRHDNAGQVQKRHHQHAAAREKRAGKERINRNLRAAAHKRRQHDGKATVALALHAARAHHGGHRAAKAHHHRNEAAAVQPQLSHRLIHQKRGARHVAAVLQNGQKQEQNHDRGQEAQHRAHARQHAVHQQRMRPSGRAKARHAGVNQANALLNQLRKAVGYPCAQRAEGDKKHKQHHRDKQRKGQDAMHSDFVDSRADALRRFLGVRYARAHHAVQKRIARVGHDGRPLHPLLPFQARDDLADDVQRVFVQRQQPFHALVALEQFGGGITRRQPLGARAFLHQMHDGVQRLVRVALTNIQLGGRFLVFRRQHGLAHQLVHAVALARADGHDRHAQRPAEALYVDHIAAFDHLVHHVQRDHHRRFQLRQL